MSRARHPSRLAEVSVAADGDWVLFGQVGEAAVPEHPQTELYRWTRATGLTEAVELPVVPDPPPGVGYPVNLRRLSEDGRRIFWTQAFYEAPSTFRRPDRSPQLKLF